MADFEIIRYTPEFEMQVAKLQSRLWFEDLDTNLRYLHWKYHQNAHGPKPIIFLAIADGRVVGMRGFWGAEIELEMPSVLQPIYKVGDAVVEEHYEKKGIFDALMTAGIKAIRRQGHTHILSFGASNMTFLAQLASGWQATAALEEHLRHRCDKWHQIRHVMKSIPILRRVARRLPKHNSENAFINLNNSKVCSRPPQLVWTKEARVDEMAQFVYRLGHDGRVRQVRNTKYLHWRLSNPMHIYRYVYWYEGDLEGYLILEAWRGKSEYVSVIDAEATRNEILLKMMEWVTNILRCSEITTWARCLPSDLSQHLAQFGFRQQEYPAAFGKNLPCIMVRSLNDGEPDWCCSGIDLRDLDNWDMRRLYVL